MATSAAPLSIPAGVWTCLNPGSAAAGACSFFPLGDKVWLAPRATETAPSTAPILTPGALLLGPKPEALINLTLAQIWPGFSTPAYVYAYVEVSAAWVTVSCA